MKSNEAESIFEMIAAVYDLHPDRRASLGTVWIPFLEGLDAADVMTVVGPWLSGDGPEKMPGMTDLKRDVKALQARRKLPAMVVSCVVCEDGGQVVVEQTMSGGAMAPCPSCDKGKALEFPLEAVGPWGPNGWWQGRSWRKLEAPLEVEVLP